MFMQKSFPFQFEIYLFVIFSIRKRHKNTIEHTTLCFVNNWLERNNCLLNYKERE